MKQVFSSFSKSSTLLILLLLGVSGLSATKLSLREFSKSINKQFNVSPNCLVDLTNKHGQIDVKTWEQQAVRVSVRIFVKSDTEEDAQEVFDRITIDFYNSNTNVSAATHIAERSSGWLSWWFNDNDEFSVKYEVYLPQDASLNVDAKYCDVYAAAIAGAGKLDIKYGNCKLDGFGEDSELNLAYGDGTIANSRDLDVELAYGDIALGEVSDLKVDVRYGKVGVDRAGDIISDSRYSNFQLGDIREFRNSGKYDNIEIQFAEEVSCETHYTNIVLKEISRRVNLDMAYGNAKIYRLSNNFDEVLLAGKYTDFKMYLMPSVGCTVEATGHYSDIRLPKSNVDVNYDSEEGSSKEVRATIGSGGNSKVSAELSYGNLIIINK